MIVGLLPQRSASAVLGQTREMMVAESGSVLQLGDARTNVVSVRQMCGTHLARPRVEKSGKMTVRGRPTVSRDVAQQYPNAKFST
jgi:predicted HicB family RNase H-like nuclease